MKGGEGKVLIIYVMVRIKADTHASLFTGSALE